MCVGIMSSVRSRRSGGFHSKLTEGRKDQRLMKDALMNDPRTSTCTVLELVLVLVQYLYEVLASTSTVRARKKNPKP